MDEALWAFGRASGFLSLGLLTASVLLGILTRSGRPLLVIPRFSVALIHRNLALLASIFLLLHVGSLLLDTYALLDLADVVVPFLGAYRPLWQGLGTVAFDLLLAIVATSLLRRRLGARVFRAVHWLAYAMWPVALAHAVGNGTEGTSGWFLGMAIGSVVLVGAAVLWRASAAFRGPARAGQRGLS
ncbi:ferric reductase-like transmembrane domain-containing protein [Arthrobacter sp. 35W]|uniref:ferric reductase-like transmembrane domain-containing protein n=1 Tax=Arthrobacter sp. 35W TaxID=1132441 RepID=UPI0004174108|nr:ferric reductase-like transmembrane domain-containing protein [Arthrobacter sp. 35W]